MQNAIKTLKIAPRQPSHIHITIDPNNTLTPTFHFQTCMSGSLDVSPAPAVNRGSEGPDVVADGLCDGVEAACVEALEPDDDTASAVDVVEGLGVGEW